MTAPVTALRLNAQTSALVWLSPKQVCDIVPGMTVRHLLYLRGKGQGPRYSKPTLKTVVYAEADVHAWVMASMQSTREQS